MPTPNLGLVLRLAGRSADAIAQFEHAATLDPGFAIAYLFLFRKRRVSSIGTARWLGPLRKEPRFQRVLQQMRFP